MKNSLSATFFVKIYFNPKSWPSEISVTPEVSENIEVSAEELQKKIDEININIQQKIDEITKIDQQIEQAQQRITELEKKIIVSKETKKRETEGFGIIEMMQDEKDLIEAKDFLKTLESIKKSYGDQLGQLNMNIVEIEQQISGATWEYEEWINDDIIEDVGDKDQDIQGVDEEVLVKLNNEQKEYLIFQSNQEAQGKELKMQNRLREKIKSQGDIFGELLNNPLLITGEEKEKIIPQVRKLLSEKKNTNWQLQNFLTTDELLDLNNGLIKVIIFDILNSLSNKYQEIKKQEHELTQEELVIFEDFLNQFFDHGWITVDEFFQSPSNIRWMLKIPNNVSVQELIDWYESYIHFSQPLTWDDSILSIIDEWMLDRKIFEKQQEFINSGEVYMSTNVVDSGGVVSFDEILNSTREDAKNEISPKEDLSLTNFAYRFAPSIWDESAWYSPRFDFMEKDTGVFSDLFNYRSVVSWSNSSSRGDVSRFMSDTLQVSVTRTSLNSQWVQVMVPKSYQEFQEAFESGKPIALSDIPIFRNISSIPVDKINTEPHLIQKTPKGIVTEYLWNQFPIPSSRNGRNATALHIQLTRHNFTEKIFRVPYEKSLFYFEKIFAKKFPDRRPEDESWRFQETIFQEMSRVSGISELNVTGQAEVEKLLFKLTDPDFYKPLEVQMRQTGMMDEAGKITETTIRKAENSTQRYQSNISLE